MNGDNKRVVFYDFDFHTGEKPHCGKPGPEFMSALYGKNPNLLPGANIR
jgi:hypothetical protein